MSNKKWEDKTFDEQRKEWRDFINELAEPKYSKGVHLIGMSLRDYFAGQALANPYTHTAIEAYRLADAMIAERDKLRTGRQKRYQGMGE